MERRRRELIQTQPERTAYLCTPEDTILAKLDGYRKGGCISDQQWRDVSGILRVQGTDLDLSYLKEWAQELGLSDLLERAFKESSLA